jgi:hypothetical protein
MISAHRASRLEAGGQQVAKVAVGAFGGDGGHHHIAGLDLLGHHMHHPVVTGVQQHRDGRAADLRACVYRPHVGLHQADAAHGFVDRCRAERGQPVGGRAVRARDVAVNNAEFVHGCLLTGPWP